MGETDTDPGGRVAKAPRLKFTWVNEPLMRERGVSQQAVRTFIRRVLDRGVYNCPLVIYFDCVPYYDHDLCFDELRDMWNGIERGDKPIAIVREKK